MTAYAPPFQSKDIMQWRNAAGATLGLFSSTGTLVRTPVDEISVLGRNTQGVRLIRLAEGERLVGIERVESLDGPEEASPDESRPQQGSG